MICFLDTSGGVPGYCTWINFYNLFVIVSFIDIVFSFVIDVVGEINEFWLKDSFLEIKLNFNLLLLDFILLYFYY